MTRNQIKFTVGFVVAVTPFLGIPYMWKNFIYVGAGVLLMLLATLVYTREHHLFPKKDSQLKDGQQKDTQPAMTPNDYTSN